MKAKTNKPAMIGTINAFDLAKIVNREGQTIAFCYDAPNPITTAFRHLDDAFGVISPISGFITRRSSVNRCIKPMTAEQAGIRFVKAGAR